MSNQAPVSLCLLMQRGPLPNHTFPLHKEVLSLGRASTNDIVIDDKEVSRHHARLTRQGNNWTLEDLGSSNGTFVNGQRITTQVWLTPGSQVGIGPDVLFSVQEQTPAAAPAAVGKTSSIPWLVLGFVAVAIVLVLVAASAAGYLLLLRPGDATPTPGSEASLAELPPPAPGPVVVFQEPAPGTRLDVGESVLVFATAWDELGVTRIDLWVDGSLVVQQLGPDDEGVTPLNLVHQLVAVAPGPHSVLARAYNSQGLAGESPTMHVTVSDVWTDQPQTAEYLVQETDTITSVADATGTTVTFIQNYNPVYAGGLSAGQIIIVPAPQSAPLPAPAQASGQAPAQNGQQGGQQPAQVPQHPPLPKPPAQPGQVPQHPPLPKPPAQPGQMGVLPGAFGPNNQPGQIGALPGLLPPQKGGGVGVLGPPPKAPIVAPNLKKLDVGDCQVTLSWDDLSDNETDFIILRWQVPGSINPVEVGRVGPNKTSYVDKVPYPGTYGYAVVAAKIQGQDRVDAMSGQLFAKVPPSAGCIEVKAQYKQVFFRPLFVVPTDPKFSWARLLIDLDTKFYRRIPSQQGNFLPAGDWTQAGIKAEAFPAPVTIAVSQSPVDFAFSVDGDNLQGDPTVLLGSHLGQHPPTQMTSDKVWIGDSDPDFAVTYNLWLEDATWTGKGSTSLLPAPTNLRFATTVAETNKVQGCGGNQCDPKEMRAIVWDYPGDLKAVDSFVLYRNYSCPGEDSQMAAPQVVRKHYQGIPLPHRVEPSGCLARYQVSAFGHAGESAPSQPLIEPTAAYFSRLQVTFKELKISDPPSMALDIQLHAYNRIRKTKPMLFTPVTYQLDNLFFDGKKPNNTITVELAEKDSLDLGVLLGGPCHMDPLSVQPEAGQDWRSFGPKSFTLKDPDGSCEATVEVVSVETLPAGATARPTADVSIDVDPKALSLMGSDLYITLENDGPDALTNHEFELTGYWVKPGTKDEPLTPVQTRKVWWMAPWQEFAPPGPIHQTLRLKVGNMIGLDPSNLPQYHVEIKPIDLDDPDPSNNVLQAVPFKK